jgi:dTDP-4-dehydrorhamnose 3,5-epimerase
VHIEQLAVPGCFAFFPTVHADHRGAFLEWFRQDLLVEQVGHSLNLAQANWSTSRRGVIRGIHYADVPPGQARYVTCVQGVVLDLVVDLRVGSPAFGRFDAVRLDDASPRAVYLPEGVGHGFCALSDDATVLYLCSTGYAPEGERGIHPLDPALALPWPDDLGPLLSPSDAAAPTLAEALDAGILPSWGDCRIWADHLARAEERRAGDAADALEEAALRQWAAHRS